MPQNIQQREELHKTIWAIANAVAHRDYTSNASVQVMLFRDRLEVWKITHQ